MAQLNRPVFAPTCNFNSAEWDTLNEELDACIASLTSLEDSQLRWEVDMAALREYVADEQWKGWRGY